MIFKQRTIICRILNNGSNITFERTTTREEYDYNDKLVEDIPALINEKIAAFQKDAVPSLNKPNVLWVRFWYQWETKDRTKWGSDSITIYNPLFSEANPNYRDENVIPVDFGRKR